MKCLKKSEFVLTPSSFQYVFVIFCIASICVSSDATNSSTKNLIYNLTLCELNVTDYAAHFPYAVEAFVIAPALTHLLSYQFLTTAHFLDFVTLGAVAVSGYVKEVYVITSIYCVCSVLAFIFFMVRFVKNALAWRYKCTRFTNFIIDTKGFLHRHKGPVLIQEHGRVLTGDGPVEVKTVVIEGQQAHLVRSITAERWES